MISRIINALAKTTRKWGVCANIGATAGTIAGGFLFILFFMHQTDPVTNQADAIKVTLILTLLCWIIALFYLVILAKLRFSSVALPSLINIFLTVYLTVFVLMQTSLWDFAPIVGFICGLLIGSTLCRINNLLN